MPRTLAIDAIPGLPEVAPGDDLGRLIAGALGAAGMDLRAGDIVVVAQKIVSKAEGRYAFLRDQTPSPRALELAAATGKDPRLVQLVLDESRAVLRHRPGLIVVETRQGFVMANAGIDQSNIRPTGSPRRTGPPPHGAPGPDDTQEAALLLPVDADASARRLRAGLEARFPAPIGVIVSDSVGRAWRLGTIGQALGSAGPVPLDDLRGQPDREGRPMQSSQVAVTDQIAAAAVLVMGEAAEGLPAARVRGLTWSPVDTPGSTLVRPASDDLFR